MRKIAVLIPCYNEELTIEKVIKDFRKEIPEAQIYVYNNNSTDRTVERAIEAGAIVKNEYIQGKGNVIKSMFREIDADIYVMVDGDDTYPAEQVYKLIEPIKEGRADMTVGDRISNGRYKQENKRIFHKFGNNLVKKTINSLFDVKLKDVMSGYRAFNKAFVKNMPVMSLNFELETEMTLYALDKNFKIVEVPITYRDRINGSVSKLNTIKDGIKVCKKIVTMYKDYRPLKFFGIISLLSFVFGFIVGVPVLIEFAKTRYITKVPSAILATGCILFSVVIAQCAIILDTIAKQHKEIHQFKILSFKQIEELKNK